MIEIDIKNWNFNNGNFVIEKGIEVSWDGENFKLELPNEVIALENLEELELYI